MTVTGTPIRPATAPEHTGAPAPWLRFADVMHAPGPGFDFYVPDLALPGGRLTAVVGPNGSGKTTLLSMITGALTPQRGEITVLDTKPGAGSLAMRARIGIQMQNAGYNRHFKVAGLMRLHRASYPVSDEAVFVLFGLPEIAGRRVSALSSGQLQRVQLALALAHHPEIAIFDEPTSALDPAYEQAFTAALRTARKENPGFTALFVTHSRDVVDICDDLICMKSGRVVDYAQKSDTLAHAFGAVGAEFEVPSREIKALLSELRDLPGQQDLRRYGNRLRIHGDATLKSAALDIAGRYPTTRFGVWDTSAADLLETFNDE